MFKNLLFALFFLPASTFGQHVISFQVEGGNRTLEGAGIRIRQGNAITHGITNQHGEFHYAYRQNVPLKVEVSFTGMSTIDTVLQEAGSRNVLLQMQYLPEVLQPVEVRSTRATDNSPFTKTNLNKAFVEKYNTGQDLPFILDQTPNVVISSDAGNGIGYTGIRIRGSDASRINMTINGIPYNDPESQFTFFVNLPDFVSSVSSIQVQRGVGTSSNGAGAFGATMNFNTLGYNPEPYLELNNSYGSYNTWKNTLKFGSGKFGEYFTFDGRISRIQSDGYIDRAFTNLLGGQGTVGFFKGQTSIRFNTMIGKERTYQAWNGISAEDLKSNRRINYSGMEKPGDPYEDETDNYWQNHYQLFVNHNFNNGWILSTATYAVTGKGFYKQYKANRKFSDYGLEPVNGESRTDLIRKLWLRNKMFGQNISLLKKDALNEWTLGGGWNDYPGRHLGEITWTEVKPDLHHVWYDHDARKTDFNAFIKWQRNLSGHFSLFTDLQYRHIRYEVEGFRDNPGIKVNEHWNFVNPKAGLAYRKDHFSGSFSYAVGNKEPNRDDFEAGILQRPKHEQLHDFEFNIGHKRLAEGLQAQLTFYYMHYKNQLVLTGKINDVGAYTRSNIPVSYRTGAEWDLSWNSANVGLRYNGSLSANKIKGFTEFADDYDIGGQKEIFHGTTNIAFSPASVHFAALSVKPVKGMEAEWMSKFVSRQFLDNTSNIDRTIDPYLTHNARLSYQFALPGIAKQVSMDFQLNNVLNKLYAPNGYTFSYIADGNFTTENYYYPMAERNWMLTLNVKF